MKLSELIQYAGPPRLAQHSRYRCMSCARPPTTEFLWAEGLAHAWFCDIHSDVFRKREVWHGVSQISAERHLRYGVASKRWRDGVPTKAEAELAQLAPHVAEMH